MRAQIFKGSTLTLQGTVKRILNVYKRADVSFSNDWYKEANGYAQSLGVRYSVSLPVACGVIAALSPIKTWHENKKIADLFLKTGRVKHTQLFRNKAEAILGANNIEQIAAILNGRKIRSFFLNILNPDNSTAVTIDRHALSICLGYNAKMYRGITAKQYEFFETCYKIASAKMKINPLLMQSITWQQWRKEKGISDENIIEPIINVPF